LFETELLRSQLLAMKKNNDSRYTSFTNELRNLKTECEKLKKVGETSDECDKFDFDVLLNL